MALDNGRKLGVAFGAAGAGKKDDSNIPTGSLLLSMSGSSSVHPPKDQVTVKCHSL